jgi:hypothetical protein
MQLRNHPAMKWHGSPNWPPHWGGAYERDAARPTGEEGLLTGVAIGAPNSKSTLSLKLTMRYRNADYSATLHFDNPTFIVRLHERLRGCEGLTLSEIGDLEID